MVFGEAQAIALGAYSFLMILGLITNGASLKHLLNERFFKGNKSRMILLLIHLSIADLVVSSIYL